MEQTSKNLRKLYFWYGIWSIAANMAHPFTPKFFTELALPDYMFGLAFASMSVGCFLTGPFWGKLSDSTGRMRLVGITTLGYAFGQSLFGIATTVPTVVAARFIAGVFSSPITVCCMAYIADVAPPNQRAQGMTLLAAVNSVGCAMGFFVGGMLGDVSISLGVWVQVISLLVSGVGFYFCVADSRPQAVQKQPFPQLLKESNPFAVLAEAGPFLTPAMKVFLLCVVSSAFATYAFDNAFNYFIKAQLQFPSSYNGIIKAVVGVTGLIANFTLNLWLARHTDIRKTIIPVFGLCAFWTLMVAVSQQNLQIVISALLFFLFNSTYIPMQQSLAMQGNGASNGVVSGIYNSAKNAGMVLGSLTAGFVYGFNSRLPFVLTAIMFAVSAFLAFITMRLMKAEREKVAA